MSKIIPEQKIDSCRKCKHREGSWTCWHPARKGDGLILATLKELPTDCPTRNGTGKGEKVLAILAENQELPENLYPGTEWFGFSNAIQAMTTPKDGMVWKKVIV